MKKIYKYKFNIRLGKFKLEVPIDSQFLTAFMQDGYSCMWLMVDPTALKHEIIFEIYGTGEEVPDGRRYLCTFPELNGQFIWHLFEVVNS